MTCTPRIFTRLLPVALFLCFQQLTLFAPRQRQRRFVYDNRFPRCQLLCEGTRVYIHMHVYTCTCTCIHTHPQRDTHSHAWHARTHAPTHTLTHTYTHLQVRGLEESLGSPNAAPAASDEDDECVLQRFFLCIFVTLPSPCVFL